MDATTKACINLHAVLSNLPELCAMDETAKGLAKGNNLTMQLAIKGGEAAHLIFKDGACEYRPGPAVKADIILGFKNGEHLNNMFDGKAMPGIKKGLTKIKFLQNNFTKLTDRMAYFLKPTEELLKDEQYFKINTYLTFHTAFFALAQIANNDKVGKINAHGVPDGIVNIVVVGGPAVHITVKDHRFLAETGASPTPRAHMIFSGLTEAAGILNGQMDFYTAVGREYIRIGGYIPMIDNASRILSQVAAYLQ
jgi:hypothetical protein